MKHNINEQIIKPRIQRGKPTDDTSLINDEILSRDMEIAELKNELRMVKKTFENDIAERVTHAALTSFKLFKVIK